MDLLPIFLNIRDRKCVIVGGGSVALRKANLLSRAQARVTVIATSICEELEALCRASNGTTVHEPFTPAQLEGAALVIAATDDGATNLAVSAAAKSLNIPVNVVDEAELCSFMMPSIVDKAPVLVAISSSGTAPVLTSKLKEMIEIVIPGRIDALANLMGSYRGQVKDKLPDPDQRLQFWQDLLESEVPELVYAGNEDAAIEVIEQRLLDRLQAAKTGTKMGEVYLVGAGPGDPDLLTLRALRLMYKADVVLYDRLVSDEIMQKLRPDAEKIYMGKEQAKSSVEQETINEMLVRLAHEGKRVLRLKGGDPFIFGRGGEELETLAAAGVPFQVVPGITAASGCAAYAGIPLTHRDHAQSVRFLTGHLREGTLDLEWEHLVREKQTLVFYMGLSGLQTICEQLIAHGMAADTPIAIIQRGTTRRQRVITDQLGGMPALAKKTGIEAPTIIIIGSVVSARKKLSWFGP
ncbi:MAG: uroporphyrinogen-III C-methyltransferase [Proteobacteria bacterium]|nr:uroporphyrinogen-III C-methyltransferase [Pseudomonadota bacterium]